MENYKIENLSFTYPNRSASALCGIDLTIKSGEFITVCGSSGCGKTTLLRLLKPIIAPSGAMTGTICFRQKPIDKLDHREQAEEIGFVMQNADNQTVTDKVWHELAFGLESLGCKSGEIRTRVAEMASYLGIHSWLHKNVSELSGGQKQLLSLASVMVMRPSVLILDEPTAQLDPIAASEFLNVLERINRELGTTVIISEHRLDDVLPVSDRVIVLEGGAVIADGEPREVGELLKDSDIYYALPTPMRVHYSVKNELQCPVSVREGRMWLEEYAASEPLKEVQTDDGEKTERDEKAIEIKGVWFRYDKALPDIIKGMELSVNKGEILAVLGGNAVGKSTLLSLISGAAVPYRGRIEAYGAVSVMPQDPQTLFSKSTVRSDLAEVLSDSSLTDTERDGRIAEVAELCRITELLRYHPYDLSGGEQQRAALAKVLLTEPDIILLDEPTKGCDTLFKIVLADILNDLKKDGVTVLIASHDIEFCAEYADRCAMLFDGDITAVGVPREFFRSNSFYTTAAARMAASTLPGAILADDVIRACGGEVKPKRKEPQKKTTPPKSGGEIPPAAGCVKDTKKKGGIAAVILTTAAAAATAAIGLYWFGDRKYYFISLLIMAQLLVPFVIRFEKKGRRAREVVMISVLCAIGVVGRVAFFMLPEVKPLTAIVIISGAALGSETGAVIGAAGALVSNLFFGQGPWTPWQMLALGLVGAVSGLCFCNGRIKRTKLSLAIFGFLSALVIYGGIINPASVIMWEPTPTAEMIAASYISGFPIDIIHASATAVFLWFISDPMIEKIDRVRVKYNI